MPGVGVLCKRAFWDAIDIKVRWSFSPCCGCGAIDIQVFQTCSRSPCGLILEILTILEILLQTAEGSRGTGPRAYGICWGRRAL